MAPRKAGCRGTCGCSGRQGVAAVGLDPASRLGRSGLAANTQPPLRSCSSIPQFIGFTAAGLPLVVTFAFLISSPVLDLASVILLDFTGTALIAGFIGKLI